MTDTPANPAPRPLTSGTPLPADGDQRVIVSVLYVAVMFLTILDATVVTVALHTIRTDLGVVDGTVEWVVTAYLLGLACTVPLAGWIAGRVGTRRLFLSAVAGFVATSVACAAASSLGMLVTARFAQGLAGGFLVPLGLAMLFGVFPPAERARAAKILAIPTAVAPATGPLLGGWITGQFGWSWVFLLNVPIGVAVLLIGAVKLAPDRTRVTPAGPPPTSSRLDWIGAVLITSGLAAVLYALSEGARNGWSAAVALTSAGGILALAGFVLRARRVPVPVIDLSVLDDRLFRSTTVVMCCSTGAFLGVLFALPLFLQDVRSMSPFQSGLTTFPEALGVIVAAQVAGRLYPRIGPRRLMAAGMAGMAVVIGLLGLALPEITDWALRAALFAVGISFGFVLIALQAASFARIAPPRMAQASSLFNTVRQMASAAGVAVLAATIAAVVARADPVQGYRAALGVAAGIALVGVAATRFVRDADAAATMVGHRPARAPSPPGPQPPGPPRTTGSPPAADAVPTAPAGGAS